MAAFFESERLHRVARELAPQGVHGAGRWYEPYPLFFTRAQGARLWDADDKQLHRSAWRTGALRSRLQPPRGAAACG